MVQQRGPTPRQSSLWPHGGIPRRPGLGALRVGGVVGRHPPPPHSSGCPSAGAVFPAQCPSNKVLRSKLRGGGGSGARACLLPWGNWTFCSAATLSLCLSPPPPACGLSSSPMCSPTRSAAALSPHQPWRNLLLGAGMGGGGAGGGLKLSEENVISHTHLQSQEPPVLW